MNTSIDYSLLGDIIIGRVDPQIYAFTTETIPNYLKVGDTYRPIQIRLDEWRRYFPNLIHRYTHSAKLDSGNIFRDHSVHDYLEFSLHCHRLEADEISQEIYYSREFFKDAQPKDIDAAIEDIQSSENKKDGRYHFYTSAHLPVKLKFERNKDFPPRKNQEVAINNFVNAYNSGRTNLLMYAVMRFGKSFTAMCCATAINAKFVLIVSAKADVRKEWQETVESHVRFEGFYFADGEDLARDNNLISSYLASNKKIALFLTLQDLQGDAIKEKHKEIFKEQIDLLIVDETHFGARAAEYGKVLREFEFSSRQINSEIKTAETTDEIDKEIKLLNTKVRLHLSGTPYRILMSDEFTKDDIIVFCQYSDIVDAKEKWDEEYGQKDEFAEWDNPYYGFPQMIRFAFTPNASAVKRMKEMREKGVTYAFSCLFQPVSILKSPDGSHKKFVNEKEILDLLEVIDGSKQDENLLGFLDYDKIKEGKMCRHIVCVLPFRASCDALEHLIISNRNRFKNLRKYEIINIAGVEDERTYSDTNRVKAKISSCEAEGKMTLTLTVNRMLTGSTVKEWDTMLFFKDTASPQEYDQAIFRIQNQYIKVYIDDKGNEIRYNMKPQTLLVDFDPYRMFRMQELKSQFYNVNTDKNGNSKLKQRIERELVISPIITLNHNKLKLVEATDVMAVVQQYSQNKSILDEANEVPVDFSLFNNEEFRAEIERMKAIDATKGLEFSPNEGDEDDDYTIPDIDPNNEQDSDSDDVSETEQSANQSNSENNQWDDLAQKYKAYQAKILFYAFLTDNRVESIEDVINSIASGNIDNRRIAKNLGLKVPILWLIFNKCNPFILRHLDYKVKNINDLMRDEQLSQIERANRATKKFARVSDAEVVTPSLLADEMVDLIPEQEISSASVILDLSTVQGELTCSLNRKYGDNINSKIYSIPSSPLAYELTRKIYKILGIPIEQILGFYSSELLEANSEQHIETLRNLNVDITIGVPPFTEKTGGGRGDGHNAIYHRYFELVRDQTNSRIIAMMMQSTWYSGGRGEGLDNFRQYMLDATNIREFHDYPNVESYIKGVTTLRGGICLFLWDRDYDGQCLFINKINRHDYPLERSLRYTHGEFRADFLIRWNKGLSILQKVLDIENTFIYEDNTNLMHRRNPFGFPNTADNFSPRRTTNASTKVYLAKGKIGYARDDQYRHTPQTEALRNRWKVMIAKSSSGNDDLPHLVISDPIVSEPGSVTANTHYIIDGVPTEIQARNLASYMRTKFFRFMVMLLRSNQNMRIDMYRFAPRLDFSRGWTDEELYERYHLTDDDKQFISLIIKEKTE